jgi:hypothetical protein
MVKYCRAETKIKVKKKCKEKRKRYFMCGVMLWCCEGVKKKRKKEEKKRVMTHTW